MRFLFGLIVAVHCLTLGATDVRFPMRGVTVTEPKEVTVAEVVDVIKPDEWFIVESESELICLTSPAGVLDVESLSGPMTFRGRFAGGDGKVETRKFSGPYLYAVTATVAGKAELIVVPVGVSAADQIHRVVLTVEGARPPPNPEPEPDVYPPVPIPGDSKRVLIVYESSLLSTLPASQSALIDSANVREYLRTHCSKGPDGVTPERRIWDEDTDLTNVPQVWKDAMGLPRTSLPWLIVSNGSAGFSGPLPVTESELLATLKRYLGE